MVKYQNESYSKGSSTFIGINPVDGSFVSFKSAKKKFSAAGIDSTATNGVVRLVRPTQVVDECNDCVTRTAESAIELRFNFVNGVDTAAMKTELDRLYTRAVALYLLDGVVPNVNANIDEE